MAVLSMKRYFLSRRFARTMLSCATGDERLLRSRSFAGHQAARREEATAVYRPLTAKYGGAAKSFQSTVNVKSSKDSTPQKNNR